jgi:hypothetical protein
MVAVIEKHLSVMLGYWQLSSAGISEISATGASASVIRRMTIVKF